MDNIEDLVLTDLQKTLLESISKNRYFTDHFYFAGGSALSSYYFQHRPSENLDFFSESNFDHSQVLDWQKTLSPAIKVHEITKPSVIAPSTLILSQSGSDQTLRLSFSFLPFRHLGNHCYLNSLRISSLEDIAIHKIKTISTPTARKRDYLDLMNSLIKLRWTDEEILRKYKTKFKSPLTLEALKTAFSNINAAIDHSNYLGDTNWDEVATYFLSRN